ncbi:hypothetical protein C4K88_13550 [Arthrobacter pityocampae]|uniref:DUF4345 domain-containing protein n=1 Tax=Arthrobacter pityocampae TaxID=547334 RepID=A0A2S5IW11_9MICC|nr:hypothetical protein [Arthrobacter pityocampae]PPB48735.1 hypothetical protein C4K88_13550 [Arthrobacter pityocampae]
MTRAIRHDPGPHRASTGLAALLLAVVGGFQAALAAGAPWGQAAYGGGHRGVLPAKYRASSAVSTLVYAGLIAVVLGRRPGPGLRRRILTGASGLMMLGTVLNLASRSRVERLVWTPVAGTLAVTLLRVARGPRRVRSRPR